MYKSLSKEDMSLMSLYHSLSPTIRSPKNVSPYNGSSNCLNRTSRAQQEVLYNHECEKALANKAGPGPGKYLYEKVHNSLSSKSNKFTIPKVRL